MTTDPTPHTERAAAAAAELNRTYIIVFSNGDIEDGREVKNQELAAIIAKHFNDDAAKLAELQAEMERRDKEQVSRNAMANHELNRVYAQRDALRLAAGRLVNAVTQLNHLTLDNNAKVLKELDDATAALSAALAGEQRGKET